MPKGKVQRSAVCSFHLLAGQYRHVPTDWAAADQHWNTETWSAAASVVFHIVFILQAV